MSALLFLHESWMCHAWPVQYWWGADICLSGIPLTCHVNNLRCCPRCVSSHPAGEARTHHYNTRPARGSYITSNGAHHFAREIIAEFTAIIAARTHHYNTQPASGSCITSNEAQHFVREIIAEFTAIIAAISLPLNCNTRNNTKGINLNWKTGKYTCFSFV